jgi:hypothetical protein
MLSHPPTLAQLRFACSAKLSSPPPPAPLPWPSNGVGYAAHPTLPFVSRPPPATNVAFFVALSFALLTAFLACKINKQSIKISQSAVCIFQNNNNNNISQWSASYPPPPPLLLLLLAHSDSTKSLCWLGCIFTHTPGHVTYTCNSLIHPVTWSTGHVTWHLYIILINFINK